MHNFKYKQVQFLITQVDAKVQRDSICELNQVSSLEPLYL